MISEEGRGATLNVGGDVPLAALDMTQDRSRGGTEDALATHELRGTRHGVATRKVFKDTSNIRTTTPAFDSRLVVAEKGGDDGRHHVGECRPKDAPEARGKL